MTNLKLILTIIIALQVVTVFGQNNHYSADGIKVGFGEFGYTHKTMTKDRFGADLYGAIKYKYEEDFIDGGIFIQYTPMYHFDLSEKVVGLSTTVGFGGLLGLEFADTYDSEEFKCHVPCTE